MNNNFNKNSLMIIKEDSETGKKLSGAVFELSSKYTKINETTNEQGLAVFNVEPCSKYILSEIAAPEGYSPIETTYKICVNSCGYVYVDGKIKNTIIIKNEPAELTVRYLSNGGTGEYTDVNMSIGDYRIKSNIEAGITNENPLKNFGSWNTKPDGTGTEYLPNEIITLTQSITLYAIWFEWRHISYNNNFVPEFSSGNSERSDKQPYTILSPDDVSQTHFDRPGYQFINWNTQRDGLGTSYNPGDLVDLNILINLSLYAQWMPE